MNLYRPIYTEKNDCQDCYKCVRTCPVKSIKVESGSAMVLDEMCVLCGKCVEVCPAGAKKVRNDLDKVKQSLRLKDKVVVSLAPSFLSEFPDYHPSQLISALKKLGFYGVSETALGAQEVSANIAVKMNNSKGEIFISSACPTINEYVKKYLPSISDKIINFYSPLLAHCKILKNNFGDDANIVFIGPCISKKKEADDNPDLLDAVLTFEDLRNWLKDEKIYPEYLPIDSEENFIYDNASEGVLYPIEGGMIEGIKPAIINKDDSFMFFSGPDHVQKALRGLEDIRLEVGNLFLELLACEGGCINGPKTLSQASTIKKRITIQEKAKQLTFVPLRKPELNIEYNINIEPVHLNSYSEHDIYEMLKEIGKYNKKDELNCGGCGYNSCRDFAVSILDNKSEKTMCVSFMRQLAQKKANALIKTMPSGVVIVDDKLKVVECNLNFAKQMGEETEMLYDVKPGIEGADLKKIFPYHSLFKTVLDSGEDLIGKEIEYNGNILLFSLFTIEQHRYVGGIFRDITEPWVRKDQIINKAKEVIKKNLSTVQKIAFLLGENASETEVTLNGIIESFSKDKIDESNL